MMIRTVPSPFGNTKVDEAFSGLCRPPKTPRLLFRLLISLPTEGAPSVLDFIAVDLAAASADVAMERVCLHANLVDC